MSRAIEITLRLMLLLVGCAARVLASLAWGLRQLFLLLSEDVLLPLEVAAHRVSQYDPRLDAYKGAQRVWERPDREGLRLQ